MRSPSLQGTFWPPIDLAVTPPHSHHLRRHGIDLRTLPALVPESLRNDSARAVEVELSARISKLKEKINSGAFEQDSSSDGRTRAVVRISHG